MSQVRYDILYDAGTTTVTTTPQGAKFPAGTKVTFQGDKDTYIKFTKGSPFEENVTNKELKLPAGPYTVKDARVRYHFQCGRMVQKNGKPVFAAWVGGGEIPLDK